MELRETTSSSRHGGVLRVTGRVPGATGYPRAQGRSLIVDDRHFLMEEAVDL
jgi:hypothetical protein